MKKKKKIRTCCGFLILIYLSRFFATFPNRRKSFKTSKKLGKVGIKLGKSWDWFLNNFSVLQEKLGKLGFLGDDPPNHLKHSIITLRRKKNIYTIIRLAVVCKMPRNQAA
jgi:hypothetical protein